MIARVLRPLVVELLVVLGHVVHTGNKLEMKAKRNMDENYNPTLFSVLPCKLYLDPQDAIEEEQFVIEA